MTEEFDEDVVFEVRKGAVVSLFLIITCDALSYLS